MTPFWVLQTEKAAAGITLTDDVLILENRYIRRSFDRCKGVTVSLLDGDGVEALETPCREGSVSVDGISYTLSGPCKINLRDGTEKKFDYTPKAYNTHVYPYPAFGMTAEIVYTFGTISATLVYEIFDDMPAIRKTLYVKNNGDKTVVVDFAETEALKLNNIGHQRYYLESDYQGKNGSGFNSQYSLFFEGNNVSAHFDMGPDFDLQPGATFRGMQVYELYCQSECFDHRMNEVQNMYRRVAPWVCEAPLFIHLISDDSQVIRDTADAISDVGLDMIIQSFGSGVDIESNNPAYIDRVKSDYDYVHSKGLDIGGYTLAIIRDYLPMNHDCATNGDHSQISRCLCTKWSEDYWNRVLSFLKKTGSDFIEIDGPYHFYTCTGNQPGQTEHLHKGLSDSRYMQWLRATVEVTARLKELGVYINAPEWLFLSGSNRTCVYYEEICYSQPRLTQLLMNRIYNYMGTYHKIPSMGWGFLPLEEYHGGGDMAKFEPMTMNLCDYDWALAQAAASGVWPCIRGKRLYDTPLCRDVVKYWVDVIRRHRTLLNSHTVHVYPPKPLPGLMTAEDLDVILQENNTTRDKLFLMVCNQTERTITKQLILPAFYTGLTNMERPHIAPISGSFDCVDIPSFGSWPPEYPKNMENLLEESVPAEDSGIHMALFEHDLPKKRTEVIIDNNGNLLLTVTLPPLSYTYYVGYEVNEVPEDPIAIPFGKPFNCSLPTKEILNPEERRKIRFDVLPSADSVDMILSAMGLPTDKREFNGNFVLVKTETYQRIHDMLRQHQGEKASSLMFALADIGISTVSDESVPEDEVWLLDGWRKE